MNTNASNDKLKNRLTLKSLAAILIGFFLIITVLTAFVVIPKINGALETQHVADSKITLSLETELFERFINNHRARLEDLARFPVVTSAALLSRSDNPDFIDLLDNFSIGNETSRIVIQDINGEIIYQTAHDILGNFTANAPWTQTVLQGDSPYKLQLLQQEGNNFRFALSVPIKYRGHIEGLLSAEIIEPLEKIFSPQLTKHGGALRLHQGNTTIQTEFDGMTVYREASTVFGDIEITHISDESKIVEAKNELNNTILITLLIGLIISFILFSLLSYSAFANKQANSVVNKTLLNRAYIMPFAIALIGVASNIFSYVFLSEQENAKQYENVQLENQRKIDAVQRAIKEKVEVLGALKIFFEASQNVERNEFSAFVNPIFDFHPDIQALKWIPKVLNSERAHYESNSQSDGLPTYPITEQDANNRLIPASRRETYFPAHYVEPRRGNEAAFGFDLASNALIQEALNKAAITKYHVGTSKLTLVQDVERQAGVIFVSPIHKSGELIGYVAMSMRINDVVRSTLQQLNLDTNIIVEDVTDASNTSLMFNHHDHNDTAEKYTTITDINVADRKWRLSAYVLETALETDTPQAVVTLPRVVLLGGLVLTVFITHSVIQLIQHRRATERIVAERTSEIQEAKNFQDLIMSSIPDLLFVKDEQFRIVNANTAFLNLYPEDIRDNIIGTTTIENYNPQEAEAFLAMDKLALSSGRSDTEETIEFPDGQLRTLLTQKVRFYDNNDDAFILGICRDITSIREAERERETLREAMENTVEGISEIDPNGRYLYLNEAYARTCGYTPYELKGKEWTTTVHKDDVAMMNQAYQSMLDTGKVVAEPRGIRKNGSIFYKRVTMISKYDDQGEFVGHHCFMSNITDRKLAEEKLLQSNIELSRFAYIASHDLQEPLRMVSNFTQLLEDDYGDKFNDEAKTYFRFITEGAQHARLLIDDLLTYARFENDQDELVQTDCNEALSKVLESFANKLDEKQANVTRTELPTISAYPLHISRLLQNLISNAIKYAADERPLQIDISCEDKGDTWLFSVKDNGIGIKKEYLEQIFVIFKRLHDKRLYQGTGIGLAICHKIVDSLHGRIWAESEIDMGTTFYISLPKDIEKQVA